MDYKLICLVRRLAATRHRQTVSRERTRRLELGLKYLSRGQGTLMSLLCCKHLTMTLTTALLRANFLPGPACTSDCWLIKTLVVASRGKSVDSSYMPLYLKETGGRACLHPFKCEEVHSSREVFGDLPASQPILRCRTLDVQKADYLDMVQAAKVAWKPFVIHLKIDVI